MIKAITHVLLLLLLFSCNSNPNYDPNIYDIPVNGQDIIIQEYLSKNDSVSIEPIGDSYFFKLFTSRINGDSLRITSSRINENTVISIETSPQDFENPKFISGIIIWSINKKEIDNYELSIFLNHLEILIKNI